MNHAMMDHSNMGHHSAASAISMSGMDHDMPGMEDKCSMNMLFTWDWKNTCVIFRWWHIKTFGGFISTFLAIVLLTALYEFIKCSFNQWQKSYVSTVSGASTNTSEITIRRFKFKRALLYGVQVGYSFLLMLVFMTYNGWLMIAVGVGAAVGNYFWGVSDISSSTRDLSCH
ncbi:putative copper transport protein [Scheffersomyces amazonensis]|uniref:putative copper transport protein n=1 Tax=Scheffersomyces amazonensis TaxID=1078765 RepID=UPI00315DFCD8